MPDFLTLDRPTPAVTVLTLNRPDKRNALSTVLRDEISATLAQLASEPELKVVVITGAGDVFCAGFDLKEFDKAFADETFATELWASSDRYHHAVLTFPLVTIAAVNGPALAGGFDLAVMCDVRIASTSSRFAHPEFTFGDIVYNPLHDLVGGAIARELCLTGRELTADEALRLHLVSELVEPGQVLARALEVADRACQAPRENLVRTKAKALRRANIASSTGTLDL